MTLAGLVVLSGSARADGDQDLLKRAQTIFGTLPAAVERADNPITDQKVKLGRMLYFEPRLSLANDISCNSCHMLDKFGVDNEPTSPGRQGQRGDRNSPTVYNAALHFVQFWDGRAANVEEQAKGPVLNPVEMAMPSEQVVVERLKGIPTYVELFGATFPDDKDPVSYENMAKAIGAFERKLVTPSAFDDYLAGNEKALSDEAKQGLATFMDTGCITCHAGPAMGGQMYQKLGLVKPYETADPGRFKVTGNEADRKMFKVPSLRNVAETGPYFHDGSVKTLPVAVRLMADHQLGKTLSDKDVDLIVAFLGSLTGRIDQAYVAKPELPK
jgi:cytochrome c peroxidase